MDDERATDDQEHEQEQERKQEQADAGRHGDPAQEDVLPDTEPVGADNIREGRVRGVMGGGPTHSEGQGQGG